MLKPSIYQTYHNYIKELLDNQRNTNIDCISNIYSKQDYQKLLNIVLKTIEENPNASITTLRLILFNKSGIQPLIKNFLEDTCITPGIILDFGTHNTRDTVLCGNAQEYTLQDNNIIKMEKPIEQDTIFDLASTSKLFTCISILKLEEMGLIDLFEPVNKYCPEFKNLGNTTIFDLLKFRIMIVTDQRVDSAKTPQEAEDILFTVHPKDDQNFSNAYTDMGAMVLRYVVEKVSKLSFNDFLTTTIFQPLNMKDTYLNVPESKLHRVANENFSTIITANGTAITRYDNIPGTPQDPKAIAIGAKQGIAPGHAGYFSTKDDMIKLGEALANYTILNQDSVLSISDTATGFLDENTFTRFYGSLVYLKQPDPKNLSVYPSLSGRSFMSPGYAGTTLVVDPLNKITLFIASPRLHNRIHNIHPSQIGNIKIDEHNKKTFVLPNGEEKVVCTDYTKAKEVLVTLALDLSLEYQLLEKIYPREKEMHLVRELN